MLSEFVLATLHDWVKQAVEAKQRASTPHVKVGVGPTKGQIANRDENVRCHRASILAEIVFASRCKKFFVNCRNNSFV